MTNLIQRMVEELQRRNCIYTLRRQDLSLQPSLVICSVDEVCHTGELWRAGQLEWIQAKITRCRRS
jgi:hypothetical protein